MATMTSLKAAAAAATPNAPRAKSAPLERGSTSVLADTMLITLPNKEPLPGDKRKRALCSLQNGEKRHRLDEKLQVPEDASPTPSPEHRSSGWTCVNSPQVASRGHETEFEDGDDYEDEETEGIDQQEQEEKRKTKEIEQGLNIQKLLAKEPTDFSLSQKRQICRWMQVRKARGVLRHITAFNKLLNDLGFIRDEYSDELKKLLRAKTYNRITNWFRAMETAGAAKIINKGIKGQEIVKYADWTDIWLHPEWDGTFAEPFLSKTQDSAFANAVGEDGPEIFAIESLGWENRRVAQPQAGGPATLEAEVEDFGESEEYEEEDSDTERGESPAQAAELSWIVLATSPRKLLLESGEETLGELDTDTDTEEERAPAQEAKFKTDSEEDGSDMAELNVTTESDDQSTLTTSQVIPTPTKSPILAQGFAIQEMIDASSQTPMLHHHGLVPYEIIPLRDATSFFVWTLQLKAILKTQNALGIMKGTLKKPVPVVVDSDLSGEKEAFKEEQEAYEHQLKLWSEKRELVMGWMLLTIGPVLRQKFAGAEDPVKVYEVLKGIYERRSNQPGGSSKID